MAKHNTQPNDHSHFRFVLLEADVSSANLQHFAQTIAAAIRGSQQLPPTPATRTLSRSADPAVEKPPEPSLFDGVEPPSEELAAEIPPTPKASNGAKRRFKAPALVPGLDYTAGPVPLEEYLNGYLLKSDRKRYLAITQWLKEHRSIIEVGAGHIYMAYKILDKTPPDDILSVFRSLKKESLVDDGAADGTYKINLVGENKLSKAKRKE